MAKLVAILVPTDTTPPVTTDDHLAVSLTTPCTVTLTPQDSGSGMVGGSAKTEYKVDGAGSYTVGTSVVLTTGEHTVLYRSTDAAGNVETPDKTFEIEVVAAVPEGDTTPPVTTDNHLAVSLVAPCTVTLTPTDAESGMVGGFAKTEYKVDDAGSSEEKVVGHQTAEASTSQEWANYKMLEPFTMPEAGLVSKLTARMANTYTNHAACNVKALLYSDDGGDPDALLATGSVVHFDDNAALAWVDLPFAAAVELEAGTYWYGFIGDATATGLLIRCLSSGGSGGYNVDTYADGPADPAGALTPDSVVNSLYATYSVPSEDYEVGTSVVMDVGEHTVVYRSTDAAGNLEDPDKTFDIVVLEEEEDPPAEGISLSASHAAIGAALTITGSGFGASQGTSTVTFGERPNARGWASCARTATVTAWSNTSITCTVPSMSPGKAATPSTYHPVYVTVGSSLSNSADFYMDPGTTYTGQNYTHQDFSAVHDRLYTGCNFTASAANTAALLIRGASYNLTFHNCTFGSSAWNGVSINELSDAAMQDITFADCEWTYSHRINFECTARSCTTRQYQRIAIIGCTLHPCGAEGLSWDGYGDWPTYNLVKDTVIEGAGNTYSLWDFGSHGFEINDGTHYTVQNLTIGRTRSFSLNLRSDRPLNSEIDWVFEDCLFDRDLVYPGQTYSPNTSLRNFMILGAHHTYWKNCTFDDGYEESFNNGQLGEGSSIQSNYNIFANCQWQGTRAVSEYAGSHDNVGLPT